MRQSKRRAYQRKMAAGICMEGGCHERAEPNRRRCAEHLRACSDAALQSRGVVRQSVYRSKYNNIDLDDAANADLVKLSALDLRLLAVGRCKCGLLLPCYGCGPTAVELAESRRGFE